MKRGLKLEEIAPIVIDIVSPHMRADERKVLVVASLTFSQLWTKEDLEPCLASAHSSLKSVPYHPSQAVAEELVAVKSKIESAVSNVDFLFSNVIPDSWCAIQKQNIEEYSSKNDHQVDIDVVFSEVVTQAKNFTCFCRDLNECTRSKGLSYLPNQPLWNPFQWEAKVFRGEDGSVFDLLLLADGVLRIVLMRIRLVQSY